MNTSVIRYRVADFLKCHAPFDGLPEQDLIDLAASGRVRFHEADEYVFNRGQSGANWVWIIQQGKIELFEDSSGASQLRDVLGEGDLLGIERFFGDGSYVSSARAASDALLYAIDAHAFEDLSARHSAVKRYLAAHFSVLAGDLGRRSWLDAEPPGMEFLKARTRALRSALSVTGAPGVPIGARQGLKPYSTRSAVQQMVSLRCEALAMDDDAVLTASDLALFCDRNPALLLRLIGSASSVVELAPLLQQAKRLIQDGLARPSDVDDCSRIATEVAAACASTCLRFAQEETVSAGIGPPAGRHCWMAFGSLARGEVLRPEAAKIGVVFDDDGEESAAASTYFNSVAGRLMAWFAACGIEGAAPVWPDGVSPNMPLSGWKQFYRETIRRPHESELFCRRELFDFRELSGDSTIFTELVSDVARELGETTLLLPLLANDTLSSLPPLTVYHGVVLGGDGAESQTLDLTTFLADPISDAARVFALMRQGGPQDTLGRLRQASLDFPESASVFANAAEAFRFALYHQTIAGTRLISLAALGKFDQRAMKTAFAAILRLRDLTTLMFVPQS